VRRHQVGLELRRGHYHDGDAEEALNKELRRSQCPCDHYNKACEDVE
jgi:hypothetical protein